jgi:alpha-N-arabinofuranosidase
MANLAQTINVLQSLILTEEEKIILTPTYHVFDMYKVHQDAMLLPVDLECRQYEYEDQRIPSLSASASQNKNGKIHVSLCNLDPNHSAEVALEFRGVNIKNVKGRVLTADKMTVHNTFEKPDNIKPGVFKSPQLKKGMIVATLPPKSVVVLEVSKE